MKTKSRNRKLIVSLIIIKF